ncbi:10110_t:CDS:2 [Racocetra fulgida]|uniref:10110_t:CDS:1 n=1 Tax=Racocetra fulgida TaxID=60492 RepID=A0A9N9A684_9GLOM|nr:10110_t:CDS:2 [Racocetra fulgida]
MTGDFSNDKATKVTFATQPSLQELSSNFPSGHSKLHLDCKNNELRCFDQTFGVKGHSRFETLSPLERYWAKYYIGNNRIYGYRAQLSNLFSHITTKPMWQNDIPIGCIGNKANGITSIQMIESTTKPSKRIITFKIIRPSTETITITREITNTIGGKVNLQQNHRIKVIVPQQFIGAAGPQAIVNVQYIAAIQWLIAQGIQLIANHDHSGYTFNVSVPANQTVPIPSGMGVALPPGVNMQETTYRQNINVTTEEQIQLELNYDVLQVVSQSDALRFSKILTQVTIRLMRLKWIKEYLRENDDNTTKVSKLDLTSYNPQDRYSKRSIYVTVGCGLESPFDGYAPRMFNGKNYTFSDSGQLIYGCEFNAKKPFLNEYDSKIQEIKKSEKDYIKNTKKEILCSYG